jgi:hypothetical protein
MSADLTYEEFIIYRKVRAVKQANPRPSTSFSDVDNQLLMIYGEETILRPP